MNEKIEKKLHELADSIKTDDSFAVDVINRIEAKSSKKTSRTINLKRNNFIGKFIMQSKTIKFATAAVIIIAALIGINQFGGSIDGASVAWADVVEQINNYTKYKCRQRVVREKGPELPTMDVYHLNLSQRRQETVSGDIHIIDMRGEDAITVELKPSQMKATVTRLIGFGPRKDPHIIEMVKRFDQESTERLGTKVVNGKTLQGFRHVPNKHNDFTVWVDPKTKLPVEIELVHTQRGQTIFLDEFEFDFNLDPLAFSTEIPAGYEITTLTQDYRKVDPKVLTAEEFKSAVSHAVYTVEKLDWIKKQVFMQTLDPLGTRTKSYLSVLKADDGNTILLMHDDYYKQEIMVWIQQQEMVLEAMGGLKVYTHPKGKKYAEKFLEAAAKTVPDYINTEDISDERFTVMVAMPDGMVVGLVSNKKLDDAKLQELVEALIKI